MEMPHLQKFAEAKDKVFELQKLRLMTMIWRLGLEKVKTGLPGLAGTDHVGFTVPDLEAATRFFVEVIGCVQVFEIGRSSRTTIGCRCVLGSIRGP